MLAAVRIRGTVNVRTPVKDTLTQLQLPQRHACMVYADKDAIRGMLDKVDGYITYGPVSPDMVVHLLEERGTVNNAPLPENVEIFGFDTVESLVNGLFSGDTAVSELRRDGLNTPFMLSPPSNGFTDTKKHVAQGGSLGKRDDMNHVLNDMV